MFKMEVTGLEEMMEALDTLPELLEKYICEGTGEAVSNEELILNEIRNSIDAMGLRTRSGNLKDSFKIVSVERTSTGVVYRVGSDAPYAKRLNDGSPPTVAYTPNRKATIIPGNKPFNYLEKASTAIEEKLLGRLSNAIERAIKEAGLS